MGSPSRTTWTVLPMPPVMPPVRSVMASSASTSIVSTRLRLVEMLNPAVYPYRRLSTTAPSIPNSTPAFRTEPMLVITKSPRLAPAGGKTPNSRSFDTL